MSYYRRLGIAVATVFSLVFTIDGQAQLGIGLRGGDPSGITIKKYTGDNALELNIGRTGYWGNRGYYNNRFNGWYDKQNFDYDDFDYIGYQASTPLSIQLHYLIHNDLNGDGADLDGLQWYYGFGAQFRFQTFRYDYRYKIQGDPNWYYAEGDRVTNIDLGVDGVIGLEYTFSELPISVFLDATLFVEIVDNPFAFWGQAGIGIRYNF